MNNEIGNGFAGFTVHLFFKKGWWTVASCPVQLLQLHGNPFHHPASMATLPTLRPPCLMLSPSFGTFASRSLSISLDWKPYRVTRSRRGLRGPLVASVGHCGPSNGVVPFLSFPFFLSFPPPRFAPLFLCWFTLSGPIRAVLTCITGWPEQSPVPSPETLAWNITSHPHLPLDLVLLLLLTSHPFHP